MSVVPRAYRRVRRNCNVFYFPSARQARAQCGWPPARRSRAWAATGSTISSPSTAPPAEPGRLQISARPRVPATARDSMPKPRPPASLARRIASTIPGASRSMHRAGAFGREVARAEAGAAGRDDQPREAVGELGAAPSATASTPSRVTRCVDHLVAGRGEPLDERAAARVVAGPAGDTVGDGQHLGRERHRSEQASRISRAAAAGSSAPKMPVPDTRMSTPASAARCALSILMPPSISISTGERRARRSRRARRAPCRAPRG